MASIQNATGHNPPWAPKLAQRLIARLYLADAKGMVDEELLDEVGYGLFARCESMIIIADASRGYVRCPQCDKMIVHNNKPQDLLKCKKCKWQKSWRAYQKTYKGQHLHPGGIEPFVRDYYERFSKAQNARQKMLLIDGLLHRWHWENKKNATKASAPNFIEGSHDDVVAFLNGLTYSQNNTPGLSRNKQEWEAKPKEYATSHLDGADIKDVLQALRSPDPKKRIEAFDILRNLPTKPKTYLQLLKTCLKDPNKKIRESAVSALAEIANENETQAKKLTPFLIPLLEDQAKKVRQKTTRHLRSLARYVPIEAAARALLNETHPDNRRPMETFLRIVLDAHAK